MPELPEVETMVRGVRPFVKGRTIAHVRRPRCACKPIAMTPGIRSIQRRAVGQAIVDVRRRAKRVLIELASGDTFVIEPRMTGLMLIADPPTQEHLRFEWSLDAGESSDGDAQRMWFWDRRGLGTLRLFNPDELEEALGPDRLGPDALDMQLDDWKERCARTSRSIKIALLDQKLVAGIGNLYASEILHGASISPLRPANELSQRQLRRLTDAVPAVLKEAIRYEGSTLGDGTYRNVLNQDGGYQNEHRVYGRAGTLCPACGRRPIERIVQAQRSTFYCPGCQG